ncbi:hypothetical protein [Profundibacter sp.]
MKKPATHVTDHALVRYLERVIGFDVDGLRRHIGGIADLGIRHGASGVQSGGFSYKLRGNTVITITPVNYPDKRTDRSRRKVKARS